MAYLFVKRLDSCITIETITNFKIGRIFNLPERVVQTKKL